MPVGTGPFRVAEWRRGERLVLDRWDDSWRGPPLLDQVIFKPVPDDAARLSLLESGDVELIGSFPLALLYRLAAESGVDVDPVPTARVLGISLNTRVAPLSDRRVRQALNYAIDRQALIETVYDGLARPLAGAVAPPLAGESGLTPYPYDPARARQLLAEASLASSLELAFVGPNGRFPKDAALAQEVQRQLQAVGVRTRLEPLDGPRYTAELTKSAEETSLRLALVSWLPVTGEASGTLYPLFHSSQWMPKGSNSSFFKNERLDALLEQLARATDPAWRDLAAARAEELLREEAPWIFLAAPSMAVARSSRLHDPFASAWELVTVDEKTWLER